MTRAGTRWVARALPLEDGARVTLLAGAGRYAVAVYGVRAPDGTGPLGSCRLALVDLADGAARRAREPCAAQETALSVALDEGGADGPTAYMGLWRSSSDGSTTVGPGRILALSAATGRVRTARPLAGAPHRLVVGSAPRPLGQAGRRLYCVEVVPGPENVGLDRGDPAYTADDRWSLLSLDPSTLDSDAAVALPAALPWLAIAPDGDDGFGLSGGGLVRIDLATGSTSRMVAFADVAVGVAATDTHVYVANPNGNAVWSADHRRVGPLRTIPVGRAPAGVFAL